MGRKTLRHAESLWHYLMVETVEAALSTVEGGTGHHAVTSTGWVWSQAGWLWLLVLAKGLWAKYFISSFLYKEKMITEES